jgi:uncharacterized protein YuzE
MDTGQLQNLSRSERVAKLFDKEPTDYQAKLLDYGEKKARAQTAPKKGRQVGATLTAGLIGADHALAGPKGTDVLFAAPSQGTANEMFRECKKRFWNSELTLDQFGVEEDNKETWEFVDGTRILARTLGNVEQTNNSGNRGMNPTCVIVDEADYTRPRVYTDEIEPFFTTHAEYEFHLFSTPADPNGYFHDKVEVQGIRDYEDALNAGSFAWYSPHWPTEISPFAQEDFIAKRKQELPQEQFLKEFRGEFPNTGDTPFPPDLINPCVSEVSEPRSERFLGVDVARQGADQTVYVDMDADGNIVEIETERESTISGIVGKIKDLDRESQYRNIVIDENGVGGGAVDFSQEDMPNVTGFTFTTKNKHNLYKSLKKAFEDKEITLPKDHQHLTQMKKQFFNLTSDYTTNGYWRVQHREGEHDDFCDAVALANWAKEGKGQTTVTYRNGNRTRSGSVR